jgi:hypothetical protein
MNFNNIKNISPGPSLGRRLAAVILCVGIILGAYHMLQKAGRDAKDTIEVVRIKRSGLQGKSVITRELIEKYGIIRREFNSDMIPYTEVEEVIGSYSLYTLRGNSVLHYDQITQQNPLKNNWLYTLESNLEVLTVPYSYLEAGGDILTPGDRIRVRASYEKGISETEGYGLITSPMNRSGQIITEVLFDDIKVVDLLNARGHSIYEVYQEVLQLTDTKKQDVLRSQNFLNSILPRSFVLEATPEQVHQYAQVSIQKNLKLTFTILSRKGNINIVDGIGMMKEEVESWTEEKESI